MNILEFAQIHLHLLGHVSGVLLSLTLLIFIVGVLLARFDNKGIRESIYLAFITAFTIGFGDITPQSPMAKILTIVIALLGLVFTGVLVAVAIKAIDLTMAL